MLVANFDFGVGNRIKESCVEINSFGVNFSLTPWSGIDAAGGGCYS